MSSPYSLLFCLFLWRVCFVEYLVALLFLFWRLSLCVSIASLWDSSSVLSLYENFQKKLWSWWVDLILSNRSSCMQKYSWSDKYPSSFSGNPIKLHPSVLSNRNCSWYMINLFPDLHHIEPDSHILQETWFLIFGSCSWYACFPILQYISSVL